MGEGCFIAYQTAEHKLYLFSDELIYGLNRTAPGTVSPLPGPFPLTAERSSCSDPHMTVDNSSGPTAGRIYAVPSTHAILGWNPSGAELTSPWPVDVGGETCGVATTNTGEVWGGNFNGPSVVKFSPAGDNIGSMAIGFSLCKIAIDQSNNDLYVTDYGGSGITKYSAAGGYSPGLVFPPGGNDAGLAINGVTHRLYVPAGEKVKAYDTTTGDLVETIDFGGGYTNSVAVDESTDTLFVADSSNSVIKEMPAALVPKATTGEPTGNSSVSGTADPDGGGHVTECFFEFGTEAENYSDQQACDQPLPYAGPQPVTATLPGLLGETEYHYRLVVGNASLGGRNFGVDKTITPHNVKGLITEAATKVTRTSAELHASFEGNGEATTYYFEWGTSGYESKSAVPPGDSAGSPTSPPKTPLAFSPSGLQPETVYHFRVVAQNGIGVSPAGDRTFETLPAVQSLTTEAATAVAPRSATLHGSYLGDGDGTTYKFEWGTSLPYEHATPIEDAGGPTGPTPLSAGLSGLELETTYHYRVVATNSLDTTAGNDQTFTTLPAVQSLTTEMASDVARRTATLEGSLVGNGDATSYEFEWGKSTFYGNSTPLTSIGSPTGLTPLSADLTGLDLETTYHFRVVATNSLGKTFGSDETFTTAPAVAGVTTLAVTDLSEEGVTLNGSFMGNGEDTNFYFELGPTTEYGAKTAESAAGSTTGPTAVATETAQFEGFTNYHYRLVASNAVGTTYGPDQTFTTLPALLPEVEEATAGNIGPTSATLSAQVNPNRWSTVYSFEYGPSISYGSSTILRTVIDGTGDSSVPISVDLNGLSPGSVYHFRVVAINLVGTTHGPDRTFVTPGPPLIDSSSSSAVTRGSAHLSAVVAPNSSPTSVHFEYGRSSAYGLRTPESGPVAGDTARHEVGADLSGLSPGTTYHFRVVAGNGVGNIAGPEGLFTTPSAEPTTVVPMTRPCKRGFVRRGGRCVKRRPHRRHRHSSRRGAER